MRRARPDYGPRFALYPPCPGDERGQVPWPWCQDFPGAFRPIFSWRPPVFAAFQPSSEGGNCVAPIAFQSPRSGRLARAEDGRWACSQAVMARPTPASMPGHQRPAWWHPPRERQDGMSNGFGQSLQPSAGISVSARVSALTNAGQRRRAARPKISSTVDLTALNRPGGGPRISHPRQGWWRRRPRVVFHRGE